MNIQEIIGKQLYIFESVPYDDDPNSVYIVSEIEFNPSISSYGIVNNILLYNTYINMYGTIYIPYMKNLDTPTSYIIITENNIKYVDIKDFNKTWFLDYNIALERGNKIRNLGIQRDTEIAPYLDSINKIDSKYKQLYYQL